jgi:hypothetical protein
MDQETSQAFSELRQFLRENMVTKQELEELRADLASKADFN